MRPKKGAVHILESNSYFPFDGSYYEQLAISDRQAMPSCVSTPDSSLNCQYGSVECGRSWVEEGEPVRITRLSAIMSASDEAISSLVTGRVGLRDLARVSHISPLTPLNVRRREKDERLIWGRTGGRIQIVGCLVQYPANRHIRQLPTKPKFTFLAHGHVKSLAAKLLRALRSGRPRFVKRLLEEDLEWFYV